MTLCLWLIEDPDGAHYDSWDAAVVVAATADEARLIHPGETEYARMNELNYAWDVVPEDLKVTLIGMAAAGLKAGDVVLERCYFSA